jgi:UDP-N-acetylmuramoylalanine--D-glutamate ligase
MMTAATISPTAFPPAARISELAGLHVVVMGLGRFGGGIGVTRYLVAQGARVTVTDQTDERALAESIARLSGLPVELRLGGHTESDLDGAELLVVSPAVDKRTSAFFQAACRRGLPWTSEMNLFLERCPARLIGITGSAGKSTTCAMLGAILNRAAEAGAGGLGRVWIGGNIGVSLLDELCRMTPADTVLLELSSFQLEDAAGLGRSPEVAAITNVAPNHLDRHGTFENYLSAKLNIIRFQRAGDVAFVRADDGPLLERVRASGAVTRARVALVEREPAGLSLRVPGRHNNRNAAMAACIATELGIASEFVTAALAEFVGLPHRLEHVGEFAGVDYYNDSKSTTPDATLTAVWAFERPLIVLIGGADKGLPLEALAVTLVSRAKAVICFGQARERLQKAVTGARGNAGTPVIESVSKMASAVERARELAGCGDVVLLSPACASYDEFANYEARGRKLAELVGDGPA